MNTIELNQVRKTYGPLCGRRHLSFHIEQGAVFVFWVERRRQDQHHPHDDRHQRRRNSGSINVFGRLFQPQGPAPYWLSSRRARAVQKDESAGTNIVFLGEASWPVRGFRAGEVALLCERLEISGWLEKKIEELSKGMQQKIQFCRQRCLHDPHSIIMDEPSRPVWTRQPGFAEKFSAGPEEAGQDNLFPLTTA